MNLEHHYAIGLEWTGNRGPGTSDYRAYGRDHLLTAAGKPAIEASADRTFHGDADRWNPEELLLAALAECHMLSYLHVATRQGIVVTAYTDAPTGTLRQNDDDGGRFTSATLHPTVMVAEQSMVERAAAAHSAAAGKCFIASSVNFPVLHLPTTVVAAQ